VQEEVRACVGSIRKIIEGLRPPVLDERGLVAALQQQADVIAQRAPSVSVRVEGDPPEGLPAAVEVVAYLIGGEAMTNALRHATPRQIVVTVAATSDELVLEVTDDGRGIPDEPTAGVGLASMAERADEIGGLLTVSSPDVGGTRVTARLPLRETTGLGVAL
jgi:signal transduction histidine kinase